MPVILDTAIYDLWLDPGMQDVAAVELLKPYDARLMLCYTVSNRVNQVANDDAKCSRRVENAEAQNRLFVSKEIFSPMSDAGKFVVLDRELEEEKGQVFPLVPV
jgi:hypothetical protein